jgi:hypothetical protein
MRDSLLTVALDFYYGLFTIRCRLTIQVAAMSFLRLFFLLLALSPVPHLAALMTEMNDSRVEYVLHAMPAETQLLSVVSAPNIVFDRPVFQMPDPETCLQLSSARCFWDIYNEIHQNDVLLCAHCTLEPNQQAPPESRYPAAHFMFLTSNRARDKQIQHELQRHAPGNSLNGNDSVYELSDDKFVCMPRPGLILYTNDRRLMRTILSRLNAWWLSRVAMPRTLTEWRYVNQKAPYWGIRHFSVNDRTSPCHQLEQGCVLDSATIGLTFEYTNNSHPVTMTYISNNADQLCVASKLIKDVDPWTAKHISVHGVDNCATQVTVSDSRCIGLAVYSVLEWFDPPCAIRLEQIRHHRK